MIAENSFVKLIGDYVGIPRGRRLRHIQNVMRTFHDYAQEMEQRAIEQAS